LLVEKLEVRQNRQDKKFESGILQY